MWSRSDILLDFNNMMSEAIGEAGLRREDLDALAPQGREIHQALVDLRRLGQLPFQELPYHEEIAQQIVRKAKSVREGFETVLLLGIGGSALGAAFLNGALGSEGGADRGPKLIVCDDVDAREWRRIAARLNWDKTLLVVVSKSGGSVETWAAFFFFEKCLRERLGDGFRKHLFVITDSKEGALRTLADEGGIESFAIPAGIGGRYSVLTPAGLFPAACAGADIGELLAGARRMDERCKSGDLWFNPALMNAVVQFLHASRRGRNIRVTMTYGGGLKSYAAWFAQLWAESLGKKYSMRGELRRAGTTPACAAGPQDQHSQLQLYLDGPEDKTVCFIGTEEGEKAEIPSQGPRARGESVLLSGKSVHDLQVVERTATEEALREAGRPNETILLKRLDAYSVGQLIYFAELETVYAGQLYGVNPFDQPAVEWIKKNIRSFLSGKIARKRNRTYMI